MSVLEDNVCELDAARRSAALKIWIDECKTRMKARWPAISFDSNQWQVHSLYGTKIHDINFEPALSDFGGKDLAYGLSLKCLMAEIAIDGDVKIPEAPMSAWRLMHRLDVPLHQLKRTHLIGVEKDLIKQAKASPSRAGRLYRDMLILRVHLDRVGAKDITERLAWNVAPQTKTQLLGYGKQASAQFKASKASILDRQIEALSDAQSSMFRGDQRLSAYDRVALAVMGLNMGCPNRINEPLCMSMDDRFTLEDYWTPEAESGAGADAPILTRVHQMLLVKGSKGAAWGAKPILNFMIAFTDMCIEVIRDSGKRSRMLVAWYEDHPETLFLPPDLEHLRGRELTRSTLWQIMQLESRQPEMGEATLVSPVWKELHSMGLIKLIANPKATRVNGSKNAVKEIQVVAWADLESLLLAKVKQAMEDIRRVTTRTHYQGRLSNMLMLFDSEQTPYLPSAVKYGALRRRLHQTKSDNKPRKGCGENWKPEPTVFEKLGIKMVVNGVVKAAYIDTHDPRRWLTTQALDAGLPDVLANKWANRLDIDQLKHYDLNTPERKAQRSAMPDIKELGDMTQGLQMLGALESEYGLKTEILVADSANIAMTSMDEIMRATADRPVARTSNQIVILYPQKYGVCLHQHHERPCRSYKCAPCNEGVVVKGHLPTNERIRKDAVLVFRSIVNQLEALLIARQRQLADSPETLDGHILTLVREGLDPEAMAKELVKRFHEINDQIKDRSFANKLAEAFALSGYVEQLDKESNRSGALIKYHNPSYHAAPGHERALEARHGSRAQVRAQIDAFDRRYPQFSKTTLGKQDQRELLGSVGDDEHGGAMSSQEEDEGVLKSGRKGGREEVLTLEVAKEIAKMVRRLPDAGVPVTWKNIEAHVSKRFQITPKRNVLSQKEWNGRRLVWEAYDDATKIEKRLQRQTTSKYASSSRAALRARITELEAEKIQLQTELDAIRERQYDELCVLWTRNTPLQKLLEDQPTTE